MGDCEECNGIGSNAYGECRECEGTGDSVETNKAISQLRAEVARLREERNVARGQIEYYVLHRDAVLDDRDALRAVVARCRLFVAAWGSQPNVQDLLTDIDAALETNK